MRTVHYRPGVSLPGPARVDLLVGRVALTDVVTVASLPTLPETAFAPHYQRGWQRCDDSTG